MNEKRPAAIDRPPALPQISAMAFRPQLFYASVFLPLLGFACSAGEPAPDGSGNGSGTDGSGGGVQLAPGTGGVVVVNNGPDPELVDAAATASCADGVLDDDEACDDRNLVSGDGCGSNCRYIEPGFVCPDAGELCRPFAKCGDGTVTFPEQCDDANLVVADGCSDTCKYEIGYTCDGAPSSCRATVCGDAQQEGAETCEQADGLPFDGCSLTCQAEPSCTDAGCTSSCGDGLIIGDEECDDGNGTDGDGCSSTCQEEDGYVCSQAAPCTGDDCRLELPIIFRDFNASHSDFQESCAAAVLGIAADKLDGQGKPTLASSEGACIASAASYAEWYTKSANNAEIVSTITLFANGAGGYVNRFGANGEQFAGPATGSGRWCGDPATYANCEEASAANQCNTPLFDAAVDQCWTVGATKGADVPANCCTNCFCAGTISQDSYDGNPLFFPIDGASGALDDARGPAKIPSQVYGAIGWPWEAPEVLHNFHFTSEIAYWFEYEEGMTADLTFIGDDDVWVFVNRRLALDLGGIHVPNAGTFALGADGNVTLRTWEPPDGTAADKEISGSTTTAAAFGLEVGGVYEIKVFHAERKMEGSSFQLTLSGFNTARSDCRPVCGDGVIAAGEQCDDGAENNIGGQNRCNANCTIGDYCGDGIVQTEFEACDDADPDRPSECAGCRIVVIK